MLRVYLYCTVMKLYIYTLQICISTCFAIRIISEFYYLISISAIQGIIIKWLIRNCELRFKDYFVKYHI